VVDDEDERSCVCLRHGTAPLRIGFMALPDSTEAAGVAQEHTPAHSALSGWTVELTPWAGEPRAPRPKSNGKRSSGLSVEGRAYLPPPPGHAVQPAMHVAATFPGASNDASLPSSCLSEGS